MQDLDDVRAEVDAEDDAVIRVVRNCDELDRCIADGATALVHCVEGGFHVGDTDAEIEQNVATLAGRGVGYITVAPAASPPTRRRSRSCPTRSITGCSRRSAAKG